MWGAVETWDAPPKEWVCECVGREVREIKEEEKITKESSAQGYQGLGVFFS